ncbi:MAG: hypothetical protein IKG01_14765 [Lachnospiraceae bacterium]|nr:hypothetical protein [Lachnospiraceae bacterium]
MEIRIELTIKEAADLIKELKGQPSLEVTSEGFSRAIRDTAREFGNK